MRRSRPLVALILIATGAACVPTRAAPTAGSPASPAAGSATGLAAAGTTSASADPPLHPAVKAAADSVLAISRSQPTGQVWADLSDSTRLRVRARQDRVATMLDRVGRGDLTRAADQILFDNLTESVQGSIGMRVCRSHLWSITNQFTGWHVAASNAARVQAVGSDSARAGAFELFRRLPAAIAAERALLQRGLDSNYTASRAVIAAVVRQLDDLLPEDVTRSPLYAPALRDSTAAFQARWRALLTDTIYPAGRAHRAFLEQQYMPRARAEGSMARQTDGPACYAALLRAQTSLGANVDSVVRDARREVDRLHRLLAPLVKGLTGEGDVSRGAILLRADRRFTFPHRDSILPAYRALTELAATRVGRVVAGFAPEPIVVAPYPEFQERANLPPQYLRAPDDGSRPAQFLVNLARTERMSVPNAVAHEAYPGHHLQRIAAVRAPVVHPAMRTLSFGGFTEGWGIYAEDLGDEMGLYTTPLDSAGYLIHLLDVAMGAYLDISYHTRGWTRQHLTDSMVALGGRPRAMAEAYADRHAATPGQLATYFLGWRAIRASREEAERALGERFSVPEFNREVVRDGYISLASLRPKMRRWIAAQAR